MNKPSIRLLCQIYTLLVLLVAAIISTLPYSLLALALLLSVFFVILRPARPRLNIITAIATIFLLPLILAPLLNYLTPLPSMVVSLVTAVAILPVIYILDYSLRQNTQHIRASVPARTRRRHTTYIFQALFSSTLAMLLISLILNITALYFTGILFALYLLIILIRILVTIPLSPFDTPAAWKRVIAGNSVDFSLDVTTRASIKIHGFISPVESWAEVTPQRFTLNRGGIKLNITLTPPLAGPVNPQFQVSVMDQWSFIQVNQLLEPVELHVIPRARYAEWLAMKYLEQAGTDTAIALTAPTAPMMPKRGVEYFESRVYQPGDQLKNIDWKHTLKLSQLVVKEYIEANDRAAIIAVNLSVTDAEEADKLAFNLITAALTLTRENIPTALAAYNQERVILTTSATEPGEILKQTLSLIKEINSIEPTQRILHLPDISQLRRNITRLKHAEAEPAQRLLGMLNLEYKALEEGTKKHPATMALSLATERTPAPAMIILVSQFNHDAEALLVTTEKLSQKEFTIIPVESIR